MTKIHALSLMDCRYSVYRDPESGLRWFRNVFEKLLDLEILWIAEIALVSLLEI